MTLTFSRLGGTSSAAAVGSAGPSVGLILLGALALIAVVGVITYRLACRRAAAAAAGAQSGAAQRLAVLEGLVRQTPYAIAVRDPSGRYLFANEPFRRMVAADADLEGTSEPLADPEQAGLRVESDAAAMQGPYAFDRWYDTSEGRRFMRSVTVPLLDQAGAVQAMGTIATDLTGQELAARALAEARDTAIFANSVKSTFLATMSHEVRTPMNAVVGMTDLLLDTALDAPQREFVETIRSSGDALVAVVNNLVDFAKIEFGDLELASAPFELRDQIEGSLDAVSVEAAAKGVDLLCYVDESCPGWVSGDAVRLRQILTNLLSNAVKFTDAGEVVLEVSGEAAADGRTRLTVSVADTGVGMAPAALDQLFSAFPGDASTTRTDGGSGLGLVISQRLAAKMAGELSATSTPGVGSTLTLTVLVGACVQHRAAVLQSTAAHLAGRSILVVDDNLANLRILNQQLSAWGMLCTTASTPSDALRALSTDTQYDLALLDLRMPEMTSAALGNAMHAVAGRHELPLVLLSNLGQPADSDSVFTAQLTKPAKSAALRDVLAGVLLARGQSPQEPTSPVSAVAGGSRLRILLAEDNPVNQRVAQLMLARLGHDVDTVSDGRQAVTAAAVRPYDVILMDIQMPHLDGKAATYEIRAAGGHQPHIVAMTASVLVQDREACAAAGLDDYLSKPVRVEALREALDGIVSTGRPIAARAVNETEPTAVARTGSPQPAVGFPAKSATTTAETPPIAAIEALATSPSGVSAPPGLAVPLGKGRPMGPEGPVGRAEPDGAASAASQGGAESVDRSVLPAESAAPGEPPAVDVSALDTLVRQLDPRDTGLRDVLLSSYLDEGAAQVSRLLMAATTSDLPTVIAMSHTLRSTSALLGAAKLASLLQLTEDAARGDSTQLIPLARQIGVEHARVAVELNRLRSPATALR